MCGRYTHLFKWTELHRLLSLTTPVPHDELPARYNVAPTQSAPVVRSVEGGGREGVLLRWGLVPFWAKDLKIGASMINARAEGIEGKPAFRAAMKKRRCVVPISGFYEWRKPVGEQPKQPFYIHSAHEEPLMLAGLWESWSPPGGECVETFSIITTTPNPLMAKLHDRMPVILDTGGVDDWLDVAGHDVPAVLPLLKPCPSEDLVAYPVSTLVNSPRNDRAECLQAIA